MPKKNFNRIKQRKEFLLFKTIHLKILRIEKYALWYGSHFKTTPLNSILHVNTNCMKISFHPQIGLLAVFYFTSKGWLPLLKQKWLSVVKCNIYLSNNYNKGFIYSSPAISDIWQVQELFNARHYLQSVCCAWLFTCLVQTSIFKKRHRKKYLCNRQNNKIEHIKNWEQSFGHLYPLKEFRCIYSFKNSCCNSTDLTHFK